MTAQGLSMSSTRQGKGLQPQAGTRSDHVRPHQGAPEIQGAGKGLQLLLHRERFEMRARGHPVLPGPAGAWRVPAELWAGASRWDRRRGAIAAWHAN